MNSNLAEQIDIHEIESGDGTRRSSGYFDMLDGVRRIQASLLSPEAFEATKEYVVRQDNTELGEAVLPNVVSRTEVIFNSENRTIYQSGFNMNQMMINGVRSAENFTGTEKFELDRRKAESANYFEKILPNAEAIIRGEKQFIELSPAPHSSDVDPEVSRKFGYDSKAGEDGIGVIRIYRNSLVQTNGIEIVQIKIPTQYSALENLLEKLGLAEESDFTGKLRDGSEILSKAGFIDPEKDFYEILKMYFDSTPESDGTFAESKADMDNFYKKIEPLRLQKMQELFEFQVQLAWRLLSDEDFSEKEAVKTLTIEKIRTWREFAKELNQRATIILEMEKDGIFAPVIIGEDDRILICGTEINASIADLLDSGAKVVRMLGLNFTEDDKGSLAFTCNTCNSVNLRSPLTGELLPRCTFCGSNSVSCESPKAFTPKVEEKVVKKIKPKAQQVAAPVKFDLNKILRLDVGAVKKAEPSKS